MRIRTPILVAALVLGAALSSRADTFGVDPVHSTALFRIKHLGTSYTHGRFNDVSGSIVTDPDLAKSSVEIVIKAESVDTHLEKRDQHLRSADFLNVKEFPTITFKSREVKSAGADAFDVTGDLTLHGVTKPLTIRVEKTGSGKDMKGNELIGFETVFTVKRSDFGMDYMVGPVGDEVRMTLAVEAGKK